MATISVTWRSPESYFTKFKVLVDGKVVSKVRQGETTTAQVTPGHHRVVVATAQLGCMSAPFDVVCREDQETALEVVGSVKRGRWSTPPAGDYFLEVRGRTVPDTGTEAESWKHWWRRPKDRT